MKFLAVVNTICLVALAGLAGFAAERLHKINHGVWYQNYLLTKDETILEYMGSSGLQAPTEDWPYWNTAVRANPLPEDLTKTIAFTKPSKCQIKEKDFCIEIVHIWNQFAALQASRAKFESLFYGHIFQESREGLSRTQIKPRYQ